MKAGIVLHLSRKQQLDTSVTVFDESLVPNKAYSVQVWGIGYITCSMKGIKVVHTRLGASMVFTAFKQTQHDTLSTFTYSISRRSQLSWIG